MSGNTATTKHSKTEENIYSLISCLVKNHASKKTGFIFLLPSLSVSPLLNQLYPNRCHNQNIYRVRV